MKRKNKIKIEVEVTCGSDFQSEFICDMLPVTMYGIKGFLEEKHKGNKVRVSFSYDFPALSHRAKEMRLDSNKVVSPFLP